MTLLFQSQQLRKYFIMGSQNCKKRDPVNVLNAALAAGITAFQFREKGDGALTGSQKQILGEKLHECCLRYHVPFIVNDDLELAELLQADGIHVGQDDIPVERVRERFPDEIIGLSVSDQNELADSPIQFVDYIGSGPVFPTISKDDAKETVGIKWLKTLRNQHPTLPIVGIGGITTGNAESVINAGADGVSVISAITEAENIEQAVRAL